MRTLLYTFLIAIALLATNSNRIYAHTSRNILKISINSKNQILINGTPSNINEIKNKVKSYIGNENYSYDGADFKDTEVEYFGIIPVTRGIVSIKCNRETTYQFFLNVNNEIEKAYSELRNEIAIRKFGKPYNNLALKYKKAINKIIPKRISEAEPDYLWVNGSLIKNNSWYYYL